MKVCKKRTKKQPKIKNQNQKKSKKYEKTQNKKHPKKSTRYIGIIKTTTAGIKNPPQNTKPQRITKRPQKKNSTGYGIQIHTIKHIHRAGNK